MHFHYKHGIGMPQMIALNKVDFLFGNKQSTQPQAL
jgi:hypothetical protein